MLVYYNPHVDDFLAEPLQFRLLKRRALKKYGFLLDEPRRNRSPVSVLVDGTSSGLIPETLFHRLPSWLRQGVASLEFWAWKRINGLGEEVQRVAIPKESVDDVLLAFSYKAATGRFQLREQTLGYYRAVVFHLSHYFLDTAEKSAHIRCLPNACLAGDSDVTGIPYFQRYFGWYSRPFLVLPFAIGARFSSRKPWLARDSRAVATGSFHDLRLERPVHKYVDFMTATGSTTYHPVRLALYQAANHMATWVNCKVNPYRQYGKSWFGRFLAHFRVAQKKYFSIDIVDLYNQHRYAIVGEELSGFPALGAFEAMACGCVILAQPQYYEGLELIPGEDYLSYEGDIEKIASTIEHGQHMPLEELSMRISEKMKTAFNPARTYKKWLREIEKLECSFKRD